MSDEVLKRTIVLVGKTGNGKSATGNTLLDRDQFTSASGADSVTKTIESATCEKVSANRHFEFTIIDTPGLFDCENVLKTALELHEVLKGEPHVFLLVLKEGRFTDEEKYTLDLLRIIFGNNVFKHTIVMVTHGGNFMNDEALEQFRSSRKVKQLIQLCENRFMKIENKTREFNFAEFLQYLTDIDTVYRNAYEEIHKSVIAKYYTEIHGDETNLKKLEDMIIKIGINTEAEHERILQETTEEFKKTEEQLIKNGINTEAEHERILQETTEEFKKTEEQLIKTNAQLKRTTNGLKSACVSMAVGVVVVLYPAVAEYVAAYFAF